MSVGVNGPGVGWVGTMTSPRPDTQARNTMDDDQQDDDRHRQPAPQASWLGRRQRTRVVEFRGSAMAPHHTGHRRTARVDVRCSIASRRAFETRSLEG